ncbi:hypothetical protein DS909_07290 [Phaeobacter gallaeciensis]|uniref:Uncharacterized protein n=1 Tax=Phaeobacter gallaeciensis TaxID=60890 RepID=A0A366X2M3_9RHOB|nr:hypothetical protein DS909_07290 [Phaeobacter gallaeciensis]
MAATIAKGFMKTHDVETPDTYSTFNRFQPKIPEKVRTAFKGRFRSNSLDISASFVSHGPQLAFTKPRVPR